MRSVTSCFNFTLFKKNLTRFWPIWAANLLIWLFVLPVDLLLTYENWPEMQRFAHYEVLTTVINEGLPLAIVISLVVAVAVWSYLYNNRSACLMHTLPIKRKGLFLTNVLSGLTMLVGPNLVVALLTLLAELAVGYVDVWSLVVWFISVTLMELFFFCFATFCAMCTGHILGLPALYGVFNILVLGVTTLVDLLLDQFVFGYAGGLSGGGLVKFLTPIWLLESNVEVRYDRVNGQRVYETAWLSGVGFILVYAAVGLILLGAAYALYRRRHMERAGDVITVGWMRPVFQYGVAFCCALAFGSVLFEIFGYEMGETVWVLLVFMLICGAVGYFVAKMLLEKSFRVFRCWKGCLPLLGALIVLTCVMEFDLTGYERRLPKLEEVEQVLISNLQTVPYDEASYTGLESEDPDVIEAALAIHQSVVEGKKDLENDNYGGMWNDDKYSYSIRIKEMVGFRVSYVLKNGNTLSRNYTVPVYDKDIGVHGTLSQRMDTLVNLPQVVEKGYGLADKAVDDILLMELTTLYVDEEKDSLRSGKVPVSSESFQKVYQAVLTDLAEGNIGRRYLMDNEERLNNCYVNDLTITFIRKDTEKDRQEQAAVIRDVPMDEAEPMPETAETIRVGGTDVKTETVSVTLQATARYTLAVLAELGVLEEPVVLVTQAGSQSLDIAYANNNYTWKGIEIAEGMETYLGK